MCLAVQCVTYVWLRGLGWTCDLFHAAYGRQLGWKSAGAAQAVSAALHMLQRDRLHDGIVYSVAQKQPMKTCRRTTR